MIVSATAPVDDVVGVVVITAASAPVTVFNETLATVPAAYESVCHEDAKKDID